MRQISRSAVLILTLLSVFSLFGCERGDNGGGRPAGQTPEVAVVTISPSRVVLTTELPGRTAAYAVSDVRPQVGGVLQARLFEEGSLVEAGQPLYQIDATLYQAAYESAQAQLANAKAAQKIAAVRAKRYASLREEKSISQQDDDDAQATLQQAEANVAQQQANLAIARINLGYTRIVAPISGRIGRSYLTQGALVKADQDQPLATIQTLDPIYVDMNQSSTELFALRTAIAGATTSDQVSAEVTLRLDDETRYPLQGELQFREVVVDPTTGTVTLRARFPNPDGILLPGMFVRATIVQGVESEALLVPQRAVGRDDQGNATALIVGADGLVERRVLQLAQMTGSDWLVKSGISAGDRVIVEGLQYARPGQPVNAVPYEAALPVSADVSSATSAAN